MHNIRGNRWIFYELISHNFHFTTFYFLRLLCCLKYSGRWINIHKTLPRIDLFDMLNRVITTGQKIFVDSFNLIVGACIFTQEVIHHFNVRASMHSAFPYCNFDFATCCFQTQHNSRFPDSIPLKVHAFISKRRCPYTYSILCNEYV